MTHVTLMTRDPRAQGLRIYNWDCGRGGAGVDHLPSILNSAAEATTANLRKLAQHTREKGK